MIEIIPGRFVTANWNLSFSFPTLGKNVRVPVASGAVGKISATVAAAGQDSKIERFIVVWQIMVGGTYYRLSTQHSPGDARVKLNPRPSNKKKK